MEKTLKVVSNNDLFDLRDKLEQEITQLAVAQLDYSAIRGELEEVEFEITRRDELDWRLPDLCCEQCTQIDEGEFK